MTTKNQPHTISKVSSASGERVHRTAAGRWTEDPSRAVIYPSADAAQAAWASIYSYAERGKDGAAKPYRLSSDSQPSKIIREQGGNAWMDAAGDIHDHE